jgi:hypothetical protein
VKWSKKDFRRQYKQQLKQRLKEVEVIEKTLRKIEEGKISENNQEARLDLLSARIIALSDSIDDINIAI